jgi:hypothetical protein
MCSNSRIAPKLKWQWLIANKLNNEGLLRIDDIMAGGEVDDYLG